MKKTCFSILLVMLLFASTLFFTANVVKASTFFSDGFESGTFSNWNVTAGASIVTGHAYAGNYSADFPLGIRESYASQPITPTSTLNYTYRVYFSNLCSDYICVVMAEDTNGSIIHYRVQNVYGNWQWQFNVGDSQVINSSTPVPQAGQWYKIQLLAITGTNSTFYFLVNDQLKATISNITFGTIDNIRIGHDWDEGYLGGDSYFDDIYATPTISPVIIASAGDGGSISPNGVISVTLGGNQSFTITPNNGYSIDNVTVDGNNVGPVNTWQFNNILSIRTITANFKINSYKIFASTDNNGQIYPSGITDLTYGSNKTFTITPNPGYHIAAVTVNGTSMGAVGSYTFTGVNSNYNISASFDANPAPTSTQLAPSATSKQVTSSSSFPSATEKPATTPSNAIPTNTATSSSELPTTITAQSPLSIIVLAGILVVGLSIILLYTKKTANEKAKLRQHL